MMANSYNISILGPTTRQYIFLELQLLRTGIDEYTALLIILIHKVQFFILLVLINSHLRSLFFVSHQTVIKKLLYIIIRGTVYIELNLIRKEGIS
jgi:hypothetical protein